MMLRCTIYCRVSTDAQERDGTSLESQERECRAYAAQQGWFVTDCLRAGRTALRRNGMAMRHAGPLLQASWPGQPNLKCLREL